MKINMITVATAFLLYDALNLFLQAKLKIDQPVNDTMITGNGRIAKLRVSKVNELIPNSRSYITQPILKRLEVVLPLAYDNPFKKSVT
jgi:hypothetical protein